MTGIQRVFDYKPSMASGNGELYLQFRGDWGSIRRKLPRILAEAYDENIRIALDVSLEGTQSNEFTDGTFAVKLALEPDNWQDKQRVFSSLERIAIQLKDDVLSHVHDNNDDEKKYAADVNEYSRVTMNILKQDYFPECEFNNKSLEINEDRAALLIRLHGISEILDIPSSPSVIKSYDEAINPHDFIKKSAPTTYAQQSVFRDAASPTLFYLNFSSEYSTDQKPGRESAERVIARLEEAGIQIWENKKYPEAERIYNVVGIKQPAFNKDGSVCDEYSTPVTVRSSEDFLPEQRAIKGNGQMKHPTQSLSLRTGIGVYIRNADEAKKVVDIVKEEAKSFDLNALEILHQVELPKPKVSCFEKIDFKKAGKILLSSFAGGLGGGDSSHLEGGGVTHVERSTSNANGQRVI